MDNDFCDFKPVGISGYVKIDTTGDPSTATNDAPLAGVTVELLDTDGNILNSTITDATGYYAFANNLPPNTYTLQAITPNGDFAEEADPGSVGGTAAGLDTIDQIVLVSGNIGVNYDFFVEPPSMISGVVFQDGPPIVLPQGATLAPSQVSLYRDGVLVAGDKRLPGVTLYLGDGNGQVILDNNLQPISTVTDANGFYQFTGLRAGDYTVLEQLPTDSQPNLVAGLITAGSTGGVALNAGATISPSIITALAIPTSSTAIVEIPLGIGVNSTNNNFSVVVTKASPPPSTPLPPPIIPPLHTDSAGRIPARAAAGIHAAGITGQFRLADPDSDVRVFHRRWCGQR